MKRTKLLFTFILAMLGLTSAIAQVDELKGKLIIPSSAGATQLTAGKWYLMYNTSSGKYLTENGTALAMKAEAPGEQANQSYTYLVQLKDCANGNYTLMTGAGNYIKQPVTSGSTGTYTDTKGQYGTYYQYKLTAMNETGHYSCCYAGSNGSGNGSGANHYLTASGNNVIGVMTAPTANSASDWTFYEVNIVGSSDELKGQAKVDFLLNQGGLIRLHNRRSANAYLTDNDGTCGAEKQNSLKQVWILSKSGDGFNLRNAATANFLSSESNYRKPTTSATKLYIQYSGNNTSAETDFVTISTAADFSDKSCLNLNNDGVTLYKWSWEGDQGSDWVIESETQFNMDDIRNAFNESKGYCNGLQDGKYYRVMAHAYELAMTEMTANHEVMGIAIDNTKFNQYWQAIQDGNNWKFKNVLTDQYIVKQNGTLSRAYTTSATASASNNFNVRSTNDEMFNTFYIVDNGNVGLHCAASQGYAVVGWNTNADASVWGFQEVNLTAEEIEAAKKGEDTYNTELAALRNADYTKLGTFFADAACTQLNEAYQSMSNEELLAAFAEAGLPARIGQIAVKVKNTWKDETDYRISKQFRVQDYQAYSVAGSWRWVNEDGKGLGASQFNDMCNPTGIYTTKRDILVVFVEDDVPAGCSLRLSAVQDVPNGFGYNNYDNGTVLHKGVNIISTEDNLRNYWMMYSVTNKNLKPAELPKLKIHIEGGYAMGYVDVQGKNEYNANKEYETILKAANKSAEASRADKRVLRMAVKGNYGMFNFQIMCYNRIWSDGSASLLANDPEVESEFEAEKWTSNYKQGFKIYKSMKFYDDVLKREWSMMGFMKHVSEATPDKPYEYMAGGEDWYPTYCNNLAYTIMGTTGSNPHSSTGYTHMPGVGGVESSYNGERQDFDNWCVGHESGHNNQGTINLESSMESSNNLFSNVITHLYGYRMSRGGSFDDNQNYSLDNKVFAWRDIGMTMRMYYNMYLYYHRAEIKPDFYPTLFCNLRKSPIRFGTGAAYDDGEHGSARTHNASTSWLHFYKKACEAAQEDLTEYFRLWGFFIPVDKGYFGDYTSYYVTCTQEMIDEAIAWVKAQGWPENKSIMFIEDRCQTIKRTDPWATGGALRPDNSGTMRDLAYLQRNFGELGNFTDYTSTGAKAANYTCKVEGRNVQMTGEGGVGFLVYDAEGNILYRSNRKSFTIPESVFTEEYVIKAVNADNTETVVASTATGIEGVASYTNTTVDKQMFDLSGRRVNGTAKSGLYIVNGKKMMIK